MKINIFTDPHLNVSRQAHTTKTSSTALNQRLFVAAMDAKSPTMPNYCAGDLFDKPFNPEWAVIQGMEVAKDCYVLSGNHDETNREGTQCSLEVIAAAKIGPVVRNPSVSGTYYEITRHRMMLVPHHASQENFVKALRLAAGESDGQYSVMVHCNRGEIMGDTPDSILVISKELEEELLQSFKRIFYGHEHGSHNNQVDGDVVTSRAVVLGNTHPTSFSDISDKYRYEYDTETDELVRFKIWSKADHYLQVVIGDAIPDAEERDLDFIEVVGTAKRSEAVEYIDSIWNAHPQALMVRSNVTYAEDEVLEVTVAEPVNLADAIYKDLDGAKRELFSQLLGQVNNGT